MKEANTSEASIMSAIGGMSVPELTALIEAAERRRREKQEAAKHELVAEFRARAAELGLSPEALLAGESEPKPARKTRDDAGTKRPAKYRGPNGEEWSGRGRLPNWLAALEAQGRKREDFKIQSEG